MFFRWIYSWLVPTFLAIFALFGIWLWGKHMEQPVYDLMMQWTARELKNSPVVLVLIDDESLDRLKPRFGGIPWPRKTYVEIFEAIHALNPALIVFDGHFVNINEAEDAEVFEALRRFPHLITGLVMDEGRSGKRPIKMNTDIPEYYRLNLGVVSMQVDPDGAIRRLKPIYKVETRPGHYGIFPALSLAGAYEFLNNQHNTQSWIMDVTDAFGNARLQLYHENRPYQGISLPLAEEQSFYLRWYKPLLQDELEYVRSHAAIPLWKLLENSKEAASLKGKIALIGSSSSFYRDYHSTPVARWHSGPDIHATAMDNILNGQAIRKASPLLNGLILLVLFSFALITRLRTPGLGRYLFYTLGTMVIYFWLALWLFGARGVWLDVVTPEAFMVVAFLMGSTFRIIWGERQLAVMEKNMSKLVSPTVFREMQRMQVLKPGGEKYEITSMFVDIRNFTTFTEHLPPAEVTELLNEFYEAIVKVVFLHWGTVDKFMGDGILIMFGAPIATKYHAMLAMEAAKEMLDVARQLSQRWRETKNINTEIGISLSSGPAFVGFLGPSDKMEYTAVGDTVNLCVRLQEQTKQFHTRLIVNELTVSQLNPDVYNVVDLGEVSVRGREATVRIFTLPEALG